MTTPRAERLVGANLRDALPAVARLRITVFREWPYLYDGTLDYEQGYLARFAAARDALIVVARDGEAIVGAATAAPLAEHTAEFVPLFEARGLDPNRIFYFGESVLLPAYRGRGLGHAFFEHREAHARGATGVRGSYTHTAFCAVVRPDDHAKRPPGSRPLDEFWTKRGYRRVDGLIGTYSWQEIGEAGETPKPMQFWMRPL